MWIDPQRRLVIEQLATDISTEAKMTRSAEWLALGRWLRSLPSKIALRPRARPVGCVLVFPPHNVPSIALYNASIAYLVGNEVLVRLDATKYPELAMWVGRIAEIKYWRREDEQETRRQSSVADLRVVWGGDEAVRAVEVIPVAEGGRSVGFGHKESVVVIDFEVWAESDYKSLLLSQIAFASQRACTSPHAIFWIGKRAKCQWAMQKWIEFTEQWNGGQFDQYSGVERANRLALEVINREALWHKGTINAPLFHLVEPAPLLCLEYGVVAHYFAESIEELDMKKIWGNNAPLQTIGVVGEIDLGARLADRTNATMIKNLEVMHDFDLNWDGIDLFSVHTVREN